MNLWLEAVGQAVGIVVCLGIFMVLVFKAFGTNRLIRVASRAALVVLLMIWLTVLIHFGLEIAP